MADQASANGIGPANIAASSGATILSTIFPASRSEKVFVVASLNAGPVAPTGGSTFNCNATLDAVSGAYQTSTYSTGGQFQFISFGDSFSVTPGNHSITIACTAGEGAAWNAGQPASIIAWGVG